MIFLGVLLGSLVMVGVLLAGYGALRWYRASGRLLAQLAHNRQVPIPACYDPSELDGLPAAVQRYFRAALTPGQPLVAAACFAHHGGFNMGADGAAWRPFTSRQQVVTRRPGFVWDARIALLPGVSVRVHDAYLAGEGVLHAALFGWLSLVNLRGDPALAQGELMRYAAEAAWYPTALLPSQGVQWEAADDHVAWATFTDGAVVLQLRFSFGADDLIESVYAPARGRLVQGNAQPTPWQVRVWDYTERDGMRVPLRGEVEWLLPQGARPYWRGHLDSVHYEFAAPVTGR